MRLLLTLEALNGDEEPLENGTVPLAVWPTNAVQLAAGGAQSRVFGIQRALDAARAATSALVTPAQEKLRLLLVAQPELARG